MGNTSAGLEAIANSHLSKILIVEDEAVVAMDLALQLTDMGYQVCGAVDNGNAAIASARVQQPSLVLIDIIIKGNMDGVETASRIRREFNIPVIFLTAYSDAKTIARAVRTAPYGYITKPFQANELRAAIEVGLYKAMLEKQLRDSEQWFASTLRCVADGVVATNNQGKVHFMNLSAEALLGWRLDDAIGHDVAEVVSLENPYTGFALESPVWRALNERSVAGIDFGTMLVARDGKKLPIDDSAAPIMDESGKALGAVMVFRDVRDRMATEEKLRRSEERFRNAFDFAPTGMALVGLDNRFLQVNSAICALLGRTATELVGANQSDFSTPDDLAQERASLYGLLSGQATSVQFEKRYRTNQTNDVDTLVSASLLGQNDEPLCFLWQIHDMTEQKAAEHQLEHLAHFDPLTGLANRTWLSDEIERQIALARRHQKQLAVVFLDLDHFKQVNDSLGHEAGDELLQAVATILKAAVRKTDMVARLGGDEFVMLLPEIRTAEEVLIVTSKIQAECDKPIHVAGHELRIGISLGVSLFPDDANDSRTLLRYADSALYHAKAEGRNNLQFYRPELMAQVEKKMQLSAGLRLAVERRAFELYYQPIVSLVNGAPLATEALIRWHHPTLGLLLPDTFIPLAEETGLSAAIGEWVIGEACRQAASWSGNGGAELTVAVNVSPQQFKAGNLVQIVRRALTRTGLDPARLCIEITEQLLLESNEHNLAIITELKSLGIKIAIDDFGVGYSSLSYIRRFGPAEIKLDCSLVRNVALNQDDAAIIKATIAMAHSLKLHVVTEGVETRDQEAFLQSEGCDMAQGYFYGQPFPAAEFCEWLRQHS